MTDQLNTATPKPKRDPRALNAYRHGLTGQIVIQTPADQVAYDKHCKGIHASLAPGNEFETDLVQSIADDRWRLKRAVAFENAVLAAGLTEPDKITANHEEIDTAFAQARIWLAKGGDITRITLYESRLQRKVEKNLKMVRESQAARQATLNQVAEEVALLTQLAKSEGETYNIERDYPRETLPPEFVFSAPEIARLAAHKIRVGQASRPVQQQKEPLRRAA